MTRREKQWRRILSTSLLDATVPSDEVSSKSDCENRANRQIKQIGWKPGLTFDMPVLGLATSPLQKSEMKTVETWMQVRR